MSDDELPELISSSEEEDEDEYSDEYDDSEADDFEQQGTSSNGYMHSSAFPEPIKVEIRNNPKDQAPFTRTENPDDDDIPPLVSSSEDENKEEVIQEDDDVPGLISEPSDDDKPHYYFNGFEMDRDDIEDSVPGMLIIAKITLMFVILSEFNWFNFLSFN
jgi:hypothetical protein